MFIYAKKIINMLATNPDELGVTVVHPLGSRDKVVSSGIATLF